MIYAPDEQTLEKNANSTQCFPDESLGIRSKGRGVSRQSFPLMGAEFLSIHIFSRTASPLVADDAFVALNPNPRRVLTDGSRLGCKLCFQSLNTFSIIMKFRGAITDSIRGLQVFLSE